VPPVSRFALYWSAATASCLGDGVRFTALPLLAASLSSAPADVALVSVAAGLPWLLFGLVAGVVVDRVSRLPLMALVQLVRAAVGATVVLGVLTGWLTIPSLVLLVFLLGTGEVLYDIAAHAVLPTIVERSRLQWANGRLVTAEVATVEFAGPALGGALFAVGVGVAFSLDAATFLASAVILFLIPGGRLVPPAQSDSTAAQARSMSRELLGAVRWFRRHVLVRSLTVQAVAGNLAVGGFYSILVLFAQRELSLGPSGYGLLLAVSAAGSMPAGMVADKVASGRRRRWVLVLAAPATFTCLAAIAALPNLVLTAAAMAAIGAVVTLANVVAVSLRQMVTPEAMLGRVTSVHRFLCWGALPLGGGLAGVVASILGVRAAILASALAVLGVGIVAVRPLLATGAAADDPGSMPAPDLAGRGSGQPRARSGRRRRCRG
jgi:MFS family permease